ncbi:AraC family transcriptional regulator [Burkholderia sp. SCN-KJ]|uniref:AraC family transcriptional regulator n=1 Tax=Burkholderia sp. SCN-KJ TaxID=2969248 RepID=UPI00214FEAF6|nr:AraC family transcriptional regulator [Burkholderia sp. SCN-KJ]MCR4471632.1 AraC family transcriptional regulator [Burkholderia sp. SCN-KJ]
MALAYPPPDPLHQLIDVFDAPLCFDQPVNSFSFPARLLNHKVVRSYSELEAIIDYFPFDFGLAAIPDACYCSTHCSTEGAHPAAKPWHNYSL